jgi:hypothetical protein
MHRSVVLSVLVGAVLAAASGFAQTRPADPPRVAPADEIKLDEAGSLKAAAIQSKMSAILANFALLQRQAQDLQTEMTKALDERKKLLEDAAKRGKVEIREPNEWVYDEANRRYVRAKKNP